MDASSPRSKHASLKRSRSELRRQIEAKPSGRVLKDKTFTHGSLSCRHVKGSLSSNGKTFLFEQIIVIRPPYCCWIRYTAPERLFQKYRNHFRNCLGSLMPYDPAALQATEAGKSVAPTQARPINGKAVRLGETTLDLIPPTGWASAPCSEPGLLLRLSPSDKMAALDVHDFGPVKPGESPRVSLNQLLENFEEAMGLNKGAWKRTEERAIASRDQRAVFRCYTDQGREAPTDLQALLLIANGKMLVVYAITAQQLRAQYFEPARASILSVLREPPTPVPAGYRAFKQPQSRLSFLVPQHWVADKSGNRIIFSGPKGSEDFRSTITFQLIDPNSPGSKHRDLNASNNEFLRQFGTNPTGSVQKDTRRMIGGHSAFWYETSFRLKGEPFRQWIAIFPREPYICWLTFTAPEAIWSRYQRHFDQCVGSVSSLEPTEGRRGRSAGLMRPLHDRMPNTLFTVSETDDVDLFMPIEEKSYLNELDEVQKQIIRKTYQGK